MRILLRRLGALAIGLALVVTPGLQARAQPAAAAKIGDLIGPHRCNQLVGYGLVAGLQGTGDQISNTPQTRQTVLDFAQRIHRTPPPGWEHARSFAAVMVVANCAHLWPLDQALDISVLAMGDATSLAGGWLQPTPLLGADGETYAMAMGPVELGQGSKSASQAPSLTGGHIAGGALATLPAIDGPSRRDPFRLRLKSPSASLAATVADAINQRYPGVAQAQGPEAVLVTPLIDQPYQLFYFNVLELEVPR